MWLQALQQGGINEAQSAMLDLLEKAEGCCLVDLGCWDGGFTVRLAEKTRASEVIGLEIVRDRVRAAMARGIKAIQADLNQPFPMIVDRTVDVVTASEIIEHIPDTDLFMKEILRVLRPGGYAVLSTCNLAGFHNLLALLIGYQPFSSSVSNEVAAGIVFPSRFGKQSDMNNGHYRVFTYQALIEFITYHGLPLKRLWGAATIPFRVVSDVFLHNSTSDMQHTLR